MTQTPNFTLGQLLDDGPLKIDLWKLFLTRMLIVGSSGYGKSWLLRVLAEQTIPRVQTIILDPEGEYSTLREKFDLLVVGAGGDVVPEIMSARLLARKLAESKVSAVIDLYDVAGPGSVWDNRRAYVAEFVDGLMTLPKALWTPMVLPIDEAHWFVPQVVGKQDSVEGRCAAAVKNLFGAGRKRKLCAIVATQRMTKLHNDVIAEAKNVFITGVSLTDDKKRAGELLGMERKEFMQLHRLEPGTFYAYGPALNHRGVIQFKSAPVQTTHPSPDQKHDLAVPEPSRAISALVAQMGDLPKQAQEEKDLVTSLQREVVTLKRELHARPVQVKPEVQKVVERVEVPVITDAQIERLARMTADTSEAVRTALAGMETAMQELMLSVKRAGVDAGKVIRAATAPTAPARFRTTAHATATRPAAHAPARADHAAVVTEGITRPQQRILDALAWLEGLGVATADRNQVGLLSEASPTSSTYGNNLGALRTSGLIAYPAPGSLALTAAGRGVATPPEIPPSSEALQDAVLRRLPAAKARILKALLDAYPEARTKGEVAILAGASATSSTFGNNLGSLRTLGLISYPTPGTAQASPILFLEQR